jgi:hypothetical protein
MKSEVMSTHSPARSRGRRVVAASLLASAAALGMLLNPATASAQVKPPGPNPVRPPTTQASPVQPDKPKQPPFGTACGYWENGEWNFYAPGERHWNQSGDLMECGNDGQWHKV